MTPEPGLVEDVIRYLRAWGLAPDGPLMAVKDLVRKGAGSALKDQPVHGRD